MAAISIVSGTSLNAFFHPCENLQSIAIQPAWRRANSELLSCIAKTRVILPEGWKTGTRTTSSPVAGMGREGMKGSRGEGGSLLPWMRGRAVYIWGDLLPRLPSGTSAARAASAVRKISRALAQHPTLLKIGCCPNCTMAAFPLLPAEKRERLTESRDILGIPGFVISDYAWFGVLSGDS